MYTIFCDGQLVYDPRLLNEKYIIISPTLTKEVNKAGSLEFVLPRDNPIYDKYLKLKSIFTVYEDEKPIWRGRAISDEKTFYSNKDVFCEGCLAFLNDIPYPPYDFSGGITKQQYLSKLMEHYLQNCSDYRKIYLGNVIVKDDASPIKKKSTDYVNILDDISSTLLEENEERYITTRLENENIFVDYYEDKSNVSYQTIEFGKNLLDLTEYIDVSNVYTRLIPLGKELEDGTYTDIRSVNDGKEYIRSEMAENLFGIITKVEKFNDIEDPETLKKQGETSLDEYIKSSLTITIKAVDLRKAGVNVDFIDVGKYAKIISKPHGIDEYYLCSKITLDLNDSSNDEYVFGITMPELTSISNK